MNQGMVIVDRQLCVTRFTPLAVRVFALLEADIGHPLLGVPTTVPIPGLQEALAAVVAGEPRRSLEAANGEVSYLVQIMPYLERDGSRRGAILTLTEVSELVAPRRAAQASLEAFKRLTDALPEAVWKRDATMVKLLYASGRFQALTGWTPAELCETCARLDDAIDPADRERVRAGRDVQQPGWCLRYGLTTRDGRSIRVEEQATVLREESGCVVVGTLRAIGEPKDQPERERGGGT
ncbi:PAS domain-containing protein [Cyanobium sp. FGCU-52]|nr:PAS domain-containing protein [Cyanobium sp. FGCU52]